MTVPTVPTATHISSLIQHAAQRGWGPQDLIHTLGPRIHPLVFRAAPLVPAALSDATHRKEWLLVDRPHDPYFAPSDLDKWEALLPGLPPLSRVSGRAQDLLPAHPAHALLGQISVFTQPAQALATAAAAHERFTRNADLQHAGTPDEDHEGVRHYIAGPYVHQKFALLGAISYFSAVNCALEHDSGIIVLCGNHANVAHVVHLYQALEKVAVASLAGSGTQAQRRQKLHNFAVQLSQHLQGCTPPALSTQHQFWQLAGVR